MNFKQECKNAANRGVLYSFIPRRLGIEGLPKYNNMPFNVMFQKFISKNGIIISGTAIYEPSFLTFQENEDNCSMIYKNIYGGNSWLKVSYNNQENTWNGLKVVNDKSAGQAFGTDWKIFFIHFTMLGLSNGEKCKLEKLDRKP